MFDLFHWRCILRLSFCKGPFVRRRRKHIRRYPPSCGRESPRGGRPFLLAAAGFSPKPLNPDPSPSPAHLMETTTPVFTRCCVPAAPHPTPTMGCLPLARSKPQHAVRSATRSPQHAPLGPWFRARSFPGGGASNSGVPRAAERAGPTPTGKKSGRRPRGAVPAAPRGSTGVLMAQLAQVSRSPVETHRTGLLVPAGEDRVLP